MSDSIGIGASVQKRDSRNGARHYGLAPTLYIHEGCIMFEDIKAGDSIVTRGVAVVKFVEQKLVIFSRKDRFGFVWDIVSYVETPMGSHLGTYHSKETAKRMALSWF